MSGFSTVLVERAGGTAGRRLIPVVLAAACFATLAIALIAQFGFGYQPCALCTDQRIAYGVAGVLAVAAFLLRSRAGAWTALTGLCGVVLLAGSAIAFYHVGVEQHWWGSVVCGGNPGGLGSLSLTDLKAQLAAHPEKPCDVVDWTIFGLSPATYNVGIFLVLGVAALATAAAWRRARP